MNKRRLKTLAKYLATIPKKHFSLDSWTRIDGGEFKNGAISKVGCDTTACAMGWACNIPEFRKAGLRLDDADIPAFKGDFGFWAAMRFFQISIWDADRLFSKHYYPSKDRNNPAAVIDKINTLLETGTTP